MRLRSTLLAVVVVASPAHAQDDRAAILTVVNNVFTAMRTRDTALLRQQFDTSARLVGVSNRGATPSLTLTTPARFGNAIMSGASGPVWNERIYDPEVRIDGTVAQVWAYYTFHAGDKFSHCGIDAFMLLKVGAAWKITQLADTQRKEGCTHTESPH